MAQELRLSDEEILELWNLAVRISLNPSTATRKRWEREGSKGRGSLTQVAGNDMYNMIEFVNRVGNGISDRLVWEWEQRMKEQKKEGR